MIISDKYSNIPMYSLYAIDITIIGSFKTMLDKMFRTILKLIKLNNVSSNNTI